MRTISQCLKLETPFSLTQEEMDAMSKWVDTEARCTYDSLDYCYLLGWFTLGNWDIPLSPKEAGFDNMRTYDD